MNKEKVTTALGVLFDEVEALIGALNEEGAEAFRAGAYDRAQRLGRDAEWVTEFRNDLRALAGRWRDFVTGKPPARRRTRRRSGARLASGLRTPEEQFRKPILEALVELGGSAPVDQVLRLVARKMQDTINEYDREPLPSPPHVVRWHNTAQWARRRMVITGLLSPNSPRGIWEITPKGRRALEEGKV